MFLHLQHEGRFAAGASVKKADYAHHWLLAEKALVNKAEFAFVSSLAGESVVKSNDFAGLSLSAGEALVKSNDFAGLCVVGPMRVSCVMHSCFARPAEMHKAIQFLRALSQRPSALSSKGAQTGVR